MEWLLFALAASLVGPVVTTVVFEFWPVLFALLTLTGSWRRTMLEGASTSNGGIVPMLALLLVGGISVSFAVLSDTNATEWSGSSVLGLLLAILSATFAALIVGFEQIMGNDTSGGSSITKWQRTIISTSGSAASQALAALVIAVVGLMALAFGSSEGWSSDGVLIALVAAPVQVGARWCFQHANHLARDAYSQGGAQVNTLYYLVPVTALLLLVWLGDTTIERSDLLLIGAAGVVVVNMALHLDPEGAQQRVDQSGGYGYRALVLALWGAGAAVLLRDDWLPDNWQVWSVVEYWGMVGVCATVFTLILAFRQSRLAERRREMDSLMLRLHRQITFMGECGDLIHPKAEAATALLREIDTARHPRTLSDSYFELRKLLMTEMQPWDDKEHAKRLSDLLADVEVLVNLRQQGRNFTELAVLTLFAFLTVTLAVAARPVAGAEPFAAWVHDTTSLVIAAAFAFLGFDLIDKRREVDAPTLRLVSRTARIAYRQPAGWRLELVAYGDKSAERVAAALLGAVILLGAVAMLGAKWL